MAGELVIPPPLDDDDDDVAWALQTAQVQWNRGALSDAVVWLHRAVDAAIASGNFQRTKQLNRLAADFAARAEQSTGAGFEPVPAGEPEPPPRAPMETLSGQIPIDVADEELDSEEVDDEAPTIPPSPWAERQEDSVITSVTPGTFPDDNPFVNALVSDDATGEIGGLAQQLEPDLSEMDEPTDPGEDEVGGSFEHEGSSGPGSVPVSASDLEPATDLDQPAPSATRSASVTADDLEPDVLANESPPDARSVAAGVAEAEPAEPVGGERGRGERFAEAADSAPAGSASASADAAAPAGSAVPPPPAEGPSSEPEEALVEGISLEGARGFEDVPPEAQLALARAARVEALSSDEEVGAFAAALVTKGRVGIMPSIADVAGGFAGPGDVVFTEGSMKEGVSLRVVALEDDTRVAVWDSAALEAATADCPWVADELREVADRFQALGGAVLGPLGERLDDGLRTTVTDRLDVQRLLAGDLIVEAGAPVPGLCVVGAGRIELVEGDTVRDELAPGDFLFATEVMAAGAAPLTARAGASGALLLRAPRGVAHELMLSVPPLLEILAE